MHGTPARGRSRSPRSSPAADTTWGLVDSVLASTSRSNSIVVATTFIVAVLCLRHGVDGLIVNLPSLAVIWSAVYGLVCLGRRRRGVQPQSRVSGQPNSPAISWQKPH
jgi:hypothetical protein